MTSYETLLNDPSTSTGAREAIRELIEAEEIQRMQLAGVMTATIQNTEETVKDRIQRGHPYWSQAYADVCAAVDREMALRTRCLQLERWKTEALTVGSWWQKIDEAVRKHPSIRLGEIVPDVALRLIAERDAFQTALKEIGGQALTDELPPEQRQYADYEGAYDLCVKRARSVS